jgi:4-hydroxy-3-polyprenylbenzoate decarboxylase
MGIDATRKIEGEGHDRPWPDEIKMSREVVDKIDRIWKELKIG